MTMLKCQAGVTSWDCSLNSMTSSGSHLRLMPLASYERSSSANILPATLINKGCVVKRQAFRYSGFCEAVVADLLDVHTLNDYCKKASNNIYP